MSGIGLASLDGGYVEVTPEQIGALESQASGRLIRAGEEGWDKAVLLWNGMIAKAPALVLQPRDARDVATAVRFARDHGLLVSIKSGGHNIAGTSIADGGLTLDMSRMRAVAVDEAARLAHVEPGCLLRDVDQATQQRGLATVLGFISQVGVSGLTLGGGLGYLARRFGWTADNLEEARSSPRTARSASRTAKTTRSCSGRSVAVAATSALSPASPSACIKSARPSTAG